MSFEIVQTESLGFCFGVSRAIDALEQALQAEQSGRKIYTFGQIVHNQTINEQLRQKGVIVTEDPDSIDSGSLVFIRAHGVGRDVMQVLRQRGVEIVDQTCPKVKRIQKIASESDNLIIAGDIAHPEVIGIVGNAKNNFFVVKDIDELKKILHNNIDKEEKYTFVAQTTFHVGLFEQMVQLVRDYDNIEVVGTICMATSERQAQVEQLSKQVEAMIIIGGKNSSNTKKLYQIASRNCPSFHIETFQELPTDIGKYKKIGLSTGASTHRSAIEEVIVNMVNENDEKVVGVEEDMVFDDKAIDAYDKRIHNGEKIEGTICAINGTEIQVDLGTKHAGFIPSEEFNGDEKPVEIGDKIEAFVVKVNDAEGTVQLSKAKLDMVKGMEKIKAAKESGEICQGKVAQVVKGGLVVIVNKIRVFVPASLATLRRTEDLSDMAGQDVRLRIIEVEEAGRRTRIIGSIKSVLKEEREKEQAAVWAGIEVGKKYTGTVKSIAAFGAFVDIGGVDGLVHITDLSWGRIKSPADVVSVGDVIEVEVKAVDLENKKISLTYKKTEDNPWVILKTKYNEGDVADVTVLKIMPYGAFVNVIPGIDGLIHISQLANHRVENVSDVLTVGQTVQAKITEIDYENKKISLSIRALLQQEEEEAEEEPPMEITSETPVEE